MLVVFCVDIQTMPSGTKSRKRAAQTATFGCRHCRLVRVFITKLSHRVMNKKVSSVSPRFLGPALPVVRVFITDF